MTKVTIVGAGSWGTALAVLLIKNNVDVTLWSYREDQVLSLRNTRINDKLPGVVLPEKLKYSSDLIGSVENADVIVMAVPSTATRSTIEKIKDVVKEDQIIVSVTKGIEESSLMTQSDIIEDVVGVKDRICVLSGPSHAEEVVDLLPTVVVCGCSDKRNAEFIQWLFMNDTFRVYTSPDVKGIEIGAALKNVIALAAGMSDGLGYGDNAKAALITRGIREISSLAVAMGGRPETLSGLAGVGDLIVTCASKHSRNRMAGMYIGQGYTPKEAMDKVKMVVEGAYSAKAALALSRQYNVAMPIIDAVNMVMFENKSAKEIVGMLMTRDKKSELDNSLWQ